MPYKGRLLVGKSYFISDDRQGSILYHSFFFFLNFYSPNTLIFLFIFSQSIGQKLLYLNYYYIEWEEFFYKVSYCVMR